MEEYMSLTGMNNQLILSGNNELDTFTEGFLPGELICIVNQPEHKTNSFIYELFLKHSVNYKVGLVVSNTAYFNQPSIHLNNNTSYSDSTQLFKEVEFNVKRWVRHYNKILVFINDLASLYLDSHKVHDERNSELGKICYGLKRIALYHKVVILTCLVHEFKSDRSLDRFNLRGLHFLGKGIHAFDHMYYVKVPKDQAGYMIQNNNSYIIENLLSIEKKPALIQL